MKSFTYHKYKLYQVINYRLKNESLKTYDNTKNKLYVWVYFYVLY